MKKYGRQGTIPIPVEHIVELDLGMDIIPVPGLRDLDVECFTSSDLTSISVDQYVYDRIEHRYRFGLAHELGHVALHRRVFEQHQFSTVAAWKKFCQRADEKDYEWLEYQAYAFAGLLLAPRAHLAREFGKALPKMQPLVERAARAGLKRDQYMDVALDYVAAHLQPVFQVSKDVLKKRMEKDRLTERIP